MTSKLDNLSHGDRARQRRFLVEFAIAIVVYIAVLFAVVAIANVVTTGPARAALALVPMIPITAIAVVTLRHLRRLDERERARLLEGLATGFVVAMLVAVLLGLLDAFELSVPFAPWWIYGAGMLAWLVASTIRRSR